MQDDMKREVTVRLRVTAEEQDSWLKAAELEQMTLSQWIRRRCNGLAAAAPVIAEPTPRKKGGK